MSKKNKNKDLNNFRLNPKKSITSIGKSRNTRPKNKHKKKNYKKYRGQGK